ncbi:N-acetyltransferase [Sandarakinorhabdus sp.]|uniref:GNAT family N-acetyltransferase n=1 Tax=Sandarakinorhabdus sp. TaxID=1916663 RepID=UPI00333EA55F
MIDIVPFAATHGSAVETLLDQRFGPARRNRTAYRLRDSMPLVSGLSFVALDGASLVGSLQCWPIRLRGISGSHWPLILLGPVAVFASREGEGIASALMRASLAASDAASAAPVLLIGDSPFYGRFGFASTATRHWQVPGPVNRDRLLSRGDCASLPRLGWLEADKCAAKVA